MPEEREDRNGRGKERGKTGGYHLQYRIFSQERNWSCATERRESEREIKRKVFFQTQYPKHTTAIAVIPKPSPKFGIFEGTRDCEEERKEKSNGAEKF
jgi:hypothetical protein